ncbi:MAG: polysaccharide biosynthesis/export family protein [Candidatus Caenarcaniphilales bacterium]|nr:polysaccharide biosynthesis/export family protein [Candidatus Caenarcaniphilales bacterium]
MKLSGAYLKLIFFFTFGLIVVISPLELHSQNSSDKKSEKHYLSSNHVNSPKNISNSQKPLKGEIFADSENNERKVDGVDKNNYSSSDFYRIAPGDTLAYKEFVHPKEFKQSGILVTRDGYASFEPLGSFRVAGKTILDVTKMLEDLISEYVIDPKVTLGVTRNHPGVAFLSGAVMNPGMVEIATYHGNPHDTEVNYGLARLSMRILNILHYGGGVRFNADLENVTVTRTHNEKTIKVNLLKALTGEDPTQDVWIEYNDRIHIPFLSPKQQQMMSKEDYLTIINSVIAPKDFPVRVIGWVEEPNVHFIKGLSPYLNSAIAQAGGFSRDAHKKKVVIRRFYNEDTFKTFMVNAEKHDVLLHPNDIVYIPELKIYKAGRILEQVNRILSPFTSVLNSATTPIILLDQ